MSDTKSDPSSGMSALWSYGPAAFAIFGSLALVALRINIGGERFITDGALMMLALASYLIAAVFHLTNLYAPFRFAEKLGMWAATLGVFFNLSSWLVRWVAAYDRELAIFNAQGPKCRGYALAIQICAIRQSV